MTARVFVDTNVWVYAVDQADEARRTRAQEVTGPDAAKDIVISSQVLTEFFTVVTRKLERPVSVEVAAEMVERLTDLPVVAVDSALVSSAIAGSREWRISLWDALIIRAAESAGCAVVLSEDLTGGGRYGSVRVVNPFS